MDLSSKVFGSNVDEKIIKYFEDLQKGTFSIEANDSVSSDTQTYLGDRTPFARMWTAVNLREAGSEDDESRNIVYVVNENKNKSYQSELESIGTFTWNSDEDVKALGYSELKKNPYLKPAAGVTGINSKSEGAVGALRRTTVDFVVHNKNDFETTE